MFIELTHYRTKKRILLNSDSIEAVKETEYEYTNIYRFQKDELLPVEESFEEVEKRLGYQIAPRAETLAKLDEIRNL